MLLFGACTRDLVPPGNYAPVGNEAGTELYGCWTELQLHGYYRKKNNAEYAGELIAIHEDSLFLLMLNNSLHIFPVTEVQKLKLVHYKYNAGNLFWFGAGMFIPNLLGMVAYPDYANSFFVLGIPTIFGAGLGTLITLTSYKIIRYPGIDNQSIQALRKYSRFPQGISNTIDPYSLESKPLWMSHRKF